VPFYLDNKPAILLAKEATTRDVENATLEEGCMQPHKLGRYLEYDGIIDEGPRVEVEIGNSIARFE